MNKNDVTRAAILMNLGSPDSPSVKDVKKYLNEFLMDGRVIDSPYILRSLLVKGIITPFRSSKSAEAYRSIWTKDGSPLVHITKQVKYKLQDLTPEITVEIAMRYGSPSMRSAYDRLKADYPSLKEVVLVPLYPHYAMSSYETAVEHAKAVHAAGAYPFTISFIPPYYNAQGYIDALTASIRPFVQDHPDSHLLFSYHSIPERHVQKSDTTGSHCLRAADCCTINSAAHKTCYKHQCLETTRLVTENLGLNKSAFSVSFQSKLGRSEWLKPATTMRLGQMPTEGIKKTMVVCPAFVSDCLETLEEVDIRERENFMGAGGESYTFIPCMNTHPAWISFLAQTIVKH